jgi:integrase
MADRLRILDAEATPRRGVERPSGQGSSPHSSHKGVDGGEVASADGLRFVVPVRTLYSGYNSKYFHVERGVTYYNALEAYRFLGEGKNAATLKQIRAALSFAYKHWDFKNPFAKIDPPIHKEPQIRYLLLADIRRLLAYLKGQQNGYGSTLAFHLANALFQTACRFDELIQLSWGDCQRVGEDIIWGRLTKEEIKYGKDTLHTRIQPDAFSVKRR